MNVKLEYQIVMTIDISKGSRRNIGNVKPSALRNKGIAVTETEVDNDEYYKLHRKYVGMIDRDRLLKLLSEMSDFSYDSLEVNNTMGALTERGCIPALAVDARDSDADMNVYISQLPADEEKVWGMIQEHPQKQKVLEEFRDVMTDTFEKLYEQLREDRESIPDSVEFDFINLRLEMEKIA